MKPTLVDVDEISKPTKQPLMLYISRKRLERAVRKLPKGKLQLKKPYLEFVPAPFSLEHLLIIPGPFPDLRRRGCRWVVRWVSTATGSHLQIQYVCPNTESSSRSCTSVALNPNFPDLFSCPMIQATCRGTCQETLGFGGTGSGLTLQCQCRSPF